MRRHDAMGRNGLRPAQRGKQVRPIVELIEQRLLLTTFTVTSTTDTSDTNLLPGTLRYAIAQANADTVSPTIINFDLSTSGTVQTISPLSPLPVITRSMTIDGTSERGFVSTPLVELNGSQAGAGATGLTVSGGNTSIMGLTIDRFAGNGIVLKSAGGNTVSQNYIGTSNTGTAAGANGLDGILVQAGSNSNSILGNLISGNKGNGINLNGVSGGTTTTTTTGNTITGNVIGLTSSGRTALGNGDDGILVYNAPSTTIGGTSAAARNVISSNTNGIELFTNSSNSVIQGNFIGTDTGGTLPLGNNFSATSGITGGGGPGSAITGYGIALRGVTNLTIGGTASGAGNVISNSNYGIGDSLPTSGAEINAITIQANSIGTNNGGTAGLGNSIAGIYFGAGTNITIGGTAAGSRNIISANAGNAIQGGPGTGGQGGAGLVIQGNYIGVAANGTTALANAGAGIITYNPSAIIGATSASQGTTGRNIIANSGQSGVEVFNATGVSILSNSIYGNGTPAIQLQNANDSITAPTLNSAISMTSSSIFTGTINGPVGTYTIQFFSNPSTSSSPQGQTLIGSATITTNSTAYNFSATVANSFLPGTLITATITNANKSTSQFSNAVTGTGTGQGTQNPTLAASVSPTTVTAGQNVVYTFTITNLGTVTEQGVNFSDAIPAGLSYVTGTAVYQNGSATNNFSVVPTSDGKTVNVAIGTIAPSGTVTIKLTLNVNTTSSTTTSITNTGSVTSTVPTVVAGADTASATLTVNPQDDLTINAFAPTSVAVSDNITYQITVGNNGPSTGTNVVLTDVLPAGVTLVSDSSDTGAPTATVSGGTLTFAIGTLNPGSVANITIVVATDPNTPTSVTDSASVTGDQTDGDPTSNTSMVTTTVVPSADLAVVSDTVSPTTIISGRPVTFTIVVQNNGPSTATSTVLTDTLPAGLVFQSGTANGGTVTASNGVVTAPIGNLASGATSTITITAMTAAFGTLNDSASVSSAVGDPNPNNNVGSAGVTASASSDLSLVFGASSGTGNIGDPLTFTATITNNGPSPATNVSFTNPLSAGTTNQSSTLNGKAAGSTANGLLTIPVGSLASGASAQITFTIIPAAAGSITETASITATEPDPNPANNSATATATIVVPSSVISFTAQETSVNETAGSATINLTRVGPTGTAVTVHFATVAGGNATPGLDYTPVDTTITFPAGVASATVTVPVLANPFDRANELVKLQLDSPTGGGILLGGGTTTTATLQIVNVNPVTVGPTVTSVKTYGPLNGITAVEIGFTGNADATTAGLAANYSFVALGGAIPAGTVIPASIASFNASTSSTLVFPMTPLPANERFTIVVNGTGPNAITDRAGNPLNSVFGSVNATNYYYTVARGTNLNYTDENGTPVNLHLTGPGVIDLDQNAAGQVERIQLLGVTNKTTISGSVTPKRKQTIIGEVLGFAQFGTVKSKLYTPPFQIHNRAYPNSFSLQGPAATDVLLGGSVSTTTTKMTTRAKVATRSLASTSSSTATASTVSAQSLATPVMATVTEIPVATAVKHPHAAVAHATHKKK